MAEIESSVRSKQFIVPVARRTKHRDKLGGMMVGSSRHYKSMAQCFGDDEHGEQVEVDEKGGNTRIAANTNSDQNLNSPGWMSHQDNARRTSVDQEQVRGSGGVRTV